jgi:hypothetical protein
MKEKKEKEKKRGRRHIMYYLRNNKKRIKNKGSPTKQRAICYLEY